MAKPSLKLTPYDDFLHHNQAALTARLRCLSDTSSLCMEKKNNYNKQNTTNVHGQAPLCRIIQLTWSRSILLRIFPLAVFGMFDTTSTPPLNLLYGATCSEIQRNRAIQATVPNVITTQITLSSLESEHELSKTIYGTDCTRKKITTVLIGTKEVI